MYKMKLTINTLILSGLLALTGSLSSCMDSYDTPVTGNAYGNNSIPEGRTISIANLKKQYADVIDVSTDTHKEITEDTRIEGVVIGSDESGNIYQQLVVADETGAIVVSISGNGLYATCPVGQKLVIDCKGLQIGGYRRLPQIGSVYNGGIGRMPLYTWKEHVRLLGDPKLYYKELTPVEISSAGELAAIDQSQAPLLVTFKNVTFAEADGETQYAPEDEGSYNWIERNMKYADGSKAPVIHTSKYANFSSDILPQGSVNVTGILNRYNSTWQLIIRTADDVQKN